VEQEARGPYQAFGRCLDDCPCRAYHAETRQENVGSAFFSKGKTHPMSQENPAEHGVHTATGQTIFSAAEVQSFKLEDRSAATAIVVLLVSIFSLGLIGYLLVCYWVS
jgi:hypothetical protein